MNAASPALFVCLFAYVIELNVYLFSPGLLARLAFIPLDSERRVPVALDERQGNTICEGKTELDGNVLVKSGPRSFALRRAYRWQNNRPFLVRITCEQQGNDTVLRAKQALIPISGPVFAFVLGLSDGPAYGFAPLEAAAMFTGIALVVTFLFGVRGRTDRDHAIAQAFDAIENDLREGTG